MSSVDLKIKCYFTGKMSLFRNGRGIAIQDIQTMANHSQVQRTRKRNVTLQRKRKKLEGAALTESPLEKTKR